MNRFSQKVLAPAVLAIATLLASGTLPADAQSRWDESETREDVQPEPAFDAPVRLKNSVRLNGNVILLRDLFENAGKHAEAAVAHAPLPGKRVVLDARWLATVANGYGLDWKPLTMGDRAMVERASQVIPVEMIEQEILAELAYHGVPASADLDMGNRTPQLHIAADAQAVVAVRDLVWDDRLRRFSATIEAPAGAPDAARTRIAGRVFTTISVPMLTRGISRGDIIGEGDVEWAETRVETMRRDALTDIADVVGKSARQTLRPGLPLTANDVQRPVLVAKGALVTMVLKMPQMSLTSQGRAIQNGAEGEMIRITNTQSNMTVEGRVEGPNLVSVQPVGRILAN